ncbi:Helicase associated domain protein [Streptosporangium sp. CA-115845]|uniref:helicase associated domain-containing protein n=1 Tax=Streptosporangium sp. CA-115845 TaxID=3240071 RepID=UPI003D93933A
MILKESKGFREHHDRSEAGDVTKAAPAVTQTLDSAQLWSHQPVAVAAIERTLRRGGRATVESACGTGKTRIAAQAAGRLAPAGRVLIMVPTLELVGQMVRTFDRHGGVALGRVVAVCSDARVLSRGNTLDVEGAQVTTDPASLAAATAGPGRLTVLATYQSLPVLAAAHARYGLKRWDLAIADEAHRTAGRAGRAWAAFHDDAMVPARRRLYMTATRKILLGDGGRDELVSMDDQGIYGPVVFRLPTSTAIERGLLADYEIVVPLVTDEEIHRLTEEQERHLRLDTALMDPRTLAMQIAVLRAAREYGIRRAISFHNRVADARHWAATLPQAWQLMEPAHRPASVSGHYVYGGQDIAERRAALERLGDDSPHSPHTESKSGGHLCVVSNARVLTEGVDAPAVDAIVLAAVRNSVIDTVQAVGRALRIGERPGKIARIVVPVFLEPGESPETALESSRYAQVWQVVRALRAHDDRLANHLDKMRVQMGARNQDAAAAADVEPSPMRPTWLSVTGAPVPEGFAAAIQVRAVQAATSTWSEYYGAARAYFAEHKDLLIHENFQTAGGLRLGKWVKKQAADHNAGVLSAEQIDLLTKIGMVWTRREEKWQHALSVARTYAEKHGSLSLIPAGLTIDGVPLSSWLKTQQVCLRNGTLSEERRLALEAVDPAWHKTVSLWGRTYQEAREFAATHKHLRPDPEYRTATGTNLLAWLDHQRDRGGTKSNRPLTAEQRKLLDEIGMVWSIIEEELRRGLAAATAYAAEHGNLDVPTMWETPEGFALGQWLATRRKFPDRLAPQDRAVLDKLDPNWVTARSTKARWNTYFQAARAYVEKHGHLPRKTGHPVPEGLDFRPWLNRQRQNAREGKLTPGRFGALTALDPGWLAGRGAKSSSDKNKKRS